MRGLLALVLNWSWERETGGSEIENGAGDHFLGAILMKCASSMVDSANLPHYVAPGGCGFA